MAELGPPGAPQQSPERWIWFGLDRLDEFAAVHGYRKGTHRPQATDRV